MAALRLDVERISTGLHNLQRDPEPRDLVLERAINLADALAAKVETLAARNPRGRLEIVLEGHKRDFSFRSDSVGDTGVIEQIFERKDYDLTRFALNSTLNSYFEGIHQRKQQPLIIDAGANIGASPIYFLLQYPDASIVAIEPERENCGLLRANCTGLDVRVIEGALVGRPGPRFLSDPGRGDWGYRVSDHGLYEVTTVTVPQILRDYPSDKYALAIVKIDIEGGEKDLFSGNVGWLEAVPLVIIELHDWMLPGEGSARNFLRAISSFDFDIVHVGENMFCFNNALLRTTKP